MTQMRSTQQIVRTIHVPPGFTLDQLKEIEFHIGKQKFVIKTDGTTAQRRQVDEHKRGASQSPRLLPE